MSYEFNPEILAKNLAFLHKVSTRGSVVVTFGEGLHGEEFVDKGMRATLVLAEIDDHFTSVKGDVDTSGKFVIDLSAHEEYNKNFESSNYYDENGIACLTARQVGEYPTDNREELYYTLSHSVLPFVEINESEAKVFESYVDEKSTESYVSWLEKKFVELGGVG